MKKMNCIAAVVTVILLGTSLVSSANSIQVNGGVGLWNDSFTEEYASDYVLGLQYGMNMNRQIQMDLAADFRYSKTYLQGLFKLGLEYPLFDAEQWRTSLVSSYSIGMGLQSDICKYQALTAGINNSLKLKDYLLSNWITIGLRDESVWSFNELDEKFYRIGLSFEPRDEGLLIRTAVELEDAPPESDRRFDTKVDIRLGYKF